MDQIQSVLQQHELSPRKCQAVVDICLVLEKTARDKTLSLLFMRQGIKKDVLCAKWVLSP